MKISILSVALCCATALWLSQPVHAESAITGVVGSVAAGDRPVDQPGSLADDELIATGEDGNASIFAEDLLAELCSNSSVMIQQSGDRQIVRIDSGSVRLLVDPTASRRAPMQIHTPLAIATVLGTEVYITVDPETGATTFTSLDHPVRIDTLDGSSFTLQGGEQIILLPGEAASAPRKLAADSMNDLGSCLADFHNAIRTMSLDMIRMERMVSTFDTVTLLDTVPPVAAAPPSVALAPPGPPASPVEEIEPVFNQTDITGSPPPGPVFRPLPPCDPAPCEHGT